MFTSENAFKIIKNLRRLSIVVHHRKREGFAVQITQVGYTEPIICSKVNNIKSKKEAVLTICDCLRWAERTYVEHKKDKTKKKSVNKLITHIERAFRTEENEIFTSDFKF